jgi:hypothetical protein
MAEIKQAEITGHDGKNARQAETDEPGDSVFFKDLIHVCLRHWKLILPTTPWTVSDP